MSISVKMNDPSSTGVNAASNNSSLTGSNAADLVRASMNTEFHSPSSSYTSPYKIEIP